MIGIIVYYVSRVCFVVVAVAVAVAVAAAVVVVVVVVPKRMLCGIFTNSESFRWDLLSRSRRVELFCGYSWRWLCGRCLLLWRCEWMVRVDFVRCPCCSDVVVTVDEDFKISDPFVQGILPIVDVLSINILSFPSGWEFVMAGSDPKKTMLLKQHSHTKCWSWSCCCIIANFHFETVALQTHVYGLEAV